MNLMRRALICLGLLPALAGGVIAAAGQRAGNQTPAEQQSQVQSAPEAGEQSAPSDQDQGGLSLSDQVIRDVLQPLQTGMTTQNIQMVLSIFDKKELAGWADLQGQLRAFFHQYDQVNFRYQILQVTAEKDRGTATADLEMDALPYNFAQVPSRRSVQMRFQIKLGGKGWKVSGFTPADFFSLGFQQPAR